MKIITLWNNTEVTGAIDNEFSSDMNKTLMNGSHDEDNSSKRFIVLYSFKSFLYLFGGKKTSQC